MEKIVIVLASDDNFAKYAGICMISIMKNLKKKRDIAFYLINNDITPDNKEKLQQIAKKYKFEFKFLEVNEKDYENFHIVEQYTKTAYYRFDAPIILSKYPKILYLDCDIILNADISELFDTDISENIIAADCSENGSFNSGVLLINTKKWIENNIKEKCIDLVKKSMKENIEFLALPDQNVLNEVFSRLENSVYNLDFCWNARTHQAFLYYDINRKHSVSLYENVVEGIKHPKLLHNTALPKPMDYKYTHKVPLNWFLKFLRYKNLSPWRNLKIENVNAKNILISISKSIGRFFTERDSKILFGLKNNICLRFLLQKFKNKKVFLYGAGTFAQDIIEKCPYPALSIRGFIDKDKNKKGTKLSGYEIFHTSDISSENCDVIIMTMVMAKKYLPEIKENIGEFEYVLL